jgi:hypothetical protein
MYTGFIWIRTGVQWWAVVNTAKNLQVPEKVGNFLVAEQLLDFQEGLYSMELGSERGYRSN